MSTSSSNSRCLLLFLLRAPRTEGFLLTYLSNPFDTSLLSTRPRRFFVIINIRRRSSLRKVNRLPNTKDTEQLQPLSRHHEGQRASYVYRHGFAVRDLWCITAHLRFDDAEHSQGDTRTQHHCSKPVVGSMSTYWSVYRSLGERE